MNYKEMINNIWDRLEEIDRMRKGVGLLSLLGTSDITKCAYHVCFYEGGYGRELHILELEDEWDRNYEMYTGNKNIEVLCILKEKYLADDGVDAYYEEVIKSELKKVEEDKIKQKKRNDEKDLREYNYLSITLKERGLI